MDKLDIGQCWITWTRLGNAGILMYICFHPDVTGLLGFVWGIPMFNQNNEGIFHTCGSYVLKQFRRKGIRTLINNTILEHNKVIHTWSGSKTGGKKFMQASGYVFDKIRHDWFLIKGKKNGKRKTVRS